MATVLISHEFMYACMSLTVCLLNTIRNLLEPTLFPITIYNNEHMPRALQLNLTVCMARQRDQVVNPAGQLQMYHVLSWGHKAVFIK